MAHHYTYHHTILPPMGDMHTGAFEVLPGPYGWVWMITRAGSSLLTENDAQEGGLSSVNREWKLPFYSENSINGDR